MSSLKDLILVPNALTSRRHGFTLFYTPKCGCGAAKIWFLATEGIVTSDPKQADEMLGMSVHRYVRKSWSGWRISKLEFALRNQKTAFVVRNPWRRLVSYYCNKIIGRKLEQFDKRGEEEKIRHMTFEELVHRISGIPDRYLDQHLKPQTFGRTDVRFDRIVKLERWADDMGALESELGLPHVHGAIARNQTSYVEGSEPVFRRKASEFREIPRYRWFYNDELRDMVAEKYKDDIALLDYKLNE